MRGTFLTIAEVAAELNISINQVRTLIRTGSLPAGRNQQGHRLIERRMLECWIEETYAESRRWVLEHRHDVYHGDSTVSDSSVA